MTAPKTRADQVTIEEYRANTSKYTFQITSGPSPEVAETKVYHIPVEKPKGSIKVQVYHPTNEAVAEGKLQNSAGLPAHVNYHGGLS